jgi:ActR/RegA family two-component response regulator
VEEDLMAKIPENATLAGAERILRMWMVERALKLEGGVHYKAARRLGIHRNTMTRIVTEEQPGKGRHARVK